MKMMTLSNIRENGVRSLAITCGALWCHHQAVLDVCAYADDPAVPSFGPRMAQSAVLSVPMMRDRIGMNGRRSVCLGQTARAFHVASAAFFGSSKLKLINGLLG